MNDVIDDLVEHALRELADVEKQRDLWLASEGPEVSSFEECAIRLLSDSGLTLALDTNETIYTIEIDEKLRQLRQTLLDIDGSRKPEAILEDPLLSRARSLARELLQDLRRFGSERE